MKYQEFKNCINPGDKSKSSYTVISDIIYLVLVATKNTKLFGAYIALWKRFNKSQNSWTFNDENGIFIIYPAEELAKTLNVSIRTSKQYLTDLKNLKIIVTSSEGVGYKNKIYFNKHDFVWEEHIENSEIKERINELEINKTFENLLKDYENEETKKRGY
ncbi:HTH domain-containing protein [Metamycoplasma phocicerebrale]|uniref:HTH domain-containing protein n=1 Tax=Metamycoplasma phocicerebrale TaxID=142649 RepID=A0A3Q9V985_9BACT|nr:HTH domain-containing protein [Metamycoplasma phocicerebrale]AZZ65389.1 HTH domain-containing protein [Metamycoplasma phocicerebrale]